MPVSACLFTRPLCQLYDACQVVEAGVLECCPLTTTERIAVAAAFSHQVRTVLQHSATVLLRGTTGCAKQVLLWDIQHKSPLCTLDFHQRAVPRRALSQPPSLRARTHTHKHTHTHTHTHTAAHVQCGMVCVCSSALSQAKPVRARSGSTEYSPGRTA